MSNISTIRRILEEQTTGIVQEARAPKFSKVQPAAGKPAVDKDGIEVSGSVVLNSGKIAFKESRDQISLISKKDNTVSEVLFVADIKLLNSLK